MITRSITQEQINKLLKEEETNPNITVTRCARCPDWEFVGLPEDGHYAFLLHRQTEHGNN